MGCCSELDMREEDSVLADRRLRLAHSLDITMKLNLLAIAIMCIVTIIQYTLPLYVYYVLY